MQQSSLFGDTPQRGSIPTHRLFFALWPGPDVRARLHRLAQDLEAAQASGGRLINPHRYHLTLQFLGDFDRLPQALAHSALAAAESVRAPAFGLRVDRAGSFANREIPWWLGSAEPDPGLALLWDRLGLALAKAGVKIVSGHRAHAPHVTVVRGAARGLGPLAVEPVEWRVDRFVLLHSVLGARSEYTVLGEWRLD